jgi:DNA-directed RNA polymerase II subunit RPB2
MENTHQHQRTPMAAQQTSEEDAIMEAPRAPAPSLSDVAPAVLQKYFGEYPNTFLTQHHIRSYEAFVFREMMDIIQAENPTTILKEPVGSQHPGVYKYKTEIFIGGDSADPNELAISVGPPIITLDKGTTVRRMFPNEARIRDLTYAASFQCDILIRTTFTSEDPAAPGKLKTQTVELKVTDFKLFTLPILLRSKLCATHAADKDLLWEMGECRNDQGGYFIIDGSEKLLITRQEQAYNSLYCAVKPPSDQYIATYASVICQHPITKQSRRVALYRLHEREGVPEGVIRVSIPYVKGAVPLFVLFRALGVESDEEIVRMILPDVNAPITRAMETTLIPSIQDAWPLTNQTQAIEFLKTLTKGFVIADVLNILRTHLFSHVPDRPLARAQYLAEIVRKMIRIEMRQEPNTNRDDIRNQRLLPTGTLLRGLFSECWKDWKKAVRLEVDKLYNYNKPLYQDQAFLNLFQSGNLNTILTTKLLNDSIMRGFRGKWGTNQYNMKTGVIQPVARISYLDSMSHTRRVISDFDTSMKLTGPRQLHPSQVGYFCTSETPTGAHIGATKNMSILTAVSVAVPHLPLMEWLFARGGVIEVSAASTALRATATSVQINGGTVGFTLNPVLLTRVLKYMKWTACLPPTASISFNTFDNILRIYLDDGRPLRPLYHLAADGKWPATLYEVKEGVEPPSWRNLVCGTLPINAERGIESADFLDPLAGEESEPRLEDYEAVLAPHIGSIEYVDPYEGNEAYISWWGREDNLTAEHTHVEIHPSSLMGLLANMIPFANHNQSPRNQLSCSQSKQGIGYYATNYESRFDTYGSMLCYGEGALCRTIVHEAVAGGQMPYGANIVFALLCFNGYNQDDGILFNRSSIERGLFRSLSLRSYATVEEEDKITKALYRIGNPRSVLAWTDLRPGLDYSGLDENGIIREGTVIHDKTVLVARYLTNKETGKISDASLMPTVFTKGRVDKVVVLHQANGLRLVRVRILEERVPELGDKFSSRHGQKGTMGMLLDAVDMPRTADGMVPDVVVNPHCIPSRMTIAQLLEQVFGKFGAAVGAKINATSFMNDGDSFTAIADALQQIGMQREGEEILYSGITGQMYTSSVFMAPLYFMRLKHLTQDKQNSRAAGRKEIRTHQPTGGRGNEGGMRIGEMERDSLIAHGVTSFLQESMMKRSDGASFVICNGCGTIPIFNETHNLYVCPLCDGPLKYQGATAETLGLVLPVRKSRTTFSRIEAPYALKLLDQEMTTFMNGGLRFLTAAGARKFREPTEMDLIYEAMEAEDSEPVAAQQAPAEVADAAVPDGGPGADEDAPADREDEGEPAKNLLPAPPAIPPGTEVIKFYSKIPEYREFSNYHPVDLMMDGLRYRSVEHYFQAMKFPDHPDYQEQIRQAKKPRDAKRMGKTEDYAIRPDWSTYRDTVMMRALREKFSDRHPELKTLLLDTGNAILQDASPRDNYWGLGSRGTGQNKLGLMLMAVRDELRGGLPAESNGNIAAPGLAFDLATMNAPQPVPDSNVAPVVVINTAAQPAVMNDAQQQLQQQQPTLQIGLEPPYTPEFQTGGGVQFAHAAYPIVNAFNASPVPSNTVILGTQANIPPCGQVPSTGATAAPSIAPVAQVPLPPQPQPDASEFKVVTVSSDPNPQGK